MYTPFESGRMLMNDLPYSFLLEVVFRSVVMYVFALIVLRLAGRRGVKQLSLFELVIIITLGSAAGDPLFYEDVGLLPALAVFATILALYRLTTHLVSKSEKLSQLMEGKPIYLIRDGEFAISNFKKEALAQDEFFAELRSRNVNHLGQVRLALLETNGEVSVFYCKDEDVKHGLPVLPHTFEERELILKPGIKYACYFCGHVESFPQQGENYQCSKCHKSGWVCAKNDKRIT